MPQLNYSAHGKIMLTGEYAALDGAETLALPTRMGQHMSVRNAKGCDLIWKSIDNKGKTWFEGVFDLIEFKPLKCTDPQIASSISKLLNAAAKYNGDFLSQWKGQEVITTLDFPMEWGLGSSSTLTYLMGEWSEVDPFDLQFEVFCGVGYDNPGAGADGPIVYRKLDDEIRYVECDFDPNFGENLFFMWLGKKQNTQEEIMVYNRNGQSVKKQDVVAKISEITNAILECNVLTEFELLIQKHENIISDLIQKPKVKSELFPDFWGQIKSLGAWGGDFVLVTSAESLEKTKQYFEQKGFNVIYKYKDFVL